MSAELLSSLLSNLWAFVLVVLLFGGSIFVHELGHFLAARRRGAHVERFSIGFGPPIWSWRGKDGVEYRIAWFPLGGYVLLPQLADLGPIEGESKVNAARLPALDYVSKLIVLVAGALFNVLFAVALACVIWVVGTPTLSFLNTTKIGTVSPTLKRDDGTTMPNPAAEAGLRPGDIVRAIDGRTVTNFEDILASVALGKGRASDGRRRAVFDIERDGKPVQLTVYPRLAGDDKIRDAGVEPAEDLTVDAVMPGSPAEAAGFKAGDTIVAIDGKSIFHRSAVSEHLGKNASRTSAFLLQRNGQRLTLEAQPRFETDDRTGKPIARIGLRYRDVIVVIHPDPWTQISRLVGSAWQNLSAVISPSSDVRPSMFSGPIGIARELHRQAQFDFRAAFSFTILINVSLAIFNLLPIPVLDGGQILFATIARVRRRELPVDVIVATQGAFIVLLLSLILYVSFFDAKRWVREMRTEPRADPPAQRAK